CCARDWPLRRPRTHQLWVLQCDGSAPTRLQHDHGSHSRPRGCLGKQQHQLMKQVIATRLHLLRSALIAGAVALCAAALGGCSDTSKRNVSTTESSVAIKLSAPKMTYVEGAAWGIRVTR